MCRCISYIASWLSCPILFADPLHDCGDIVCTMMMVWSQASNERHDNAMIAWQDCSSVIVAVQS